MFCRFAKHSLDFRKLFIQKLFCLRLYVKPQKRLGIARSAVEPPILILNGRAVEVVIVAFFILLCQLFHHSLFVVNIEVDLAACEIAFERLDQFAERLLRLMEDVQNVGERDHRRIGIEIVAVIIVAGKLAAEDAVRVAERFFHKDVADAVAAGGAAEFLDFLFDNPTASQVINDGGLGFFFQKVRHHYAEHQVGRHGAAFFIDHYKAVGVAVETYADMGAFLDNPLFKLGKIFLYQRVRLVLECAVGGEIDRDDLDGDTSRAEWGSEVYEYEALDSQYTKKDGYKEAYTTTGAFSVPQASTYLLIRLGLRPLENHHIWRRLATLASRGVPGRASSRLAKS
jgi:hypothetical protein